MAEFGPILREEKDKIMGSIIVGVVLGAAVVVLNFKILLYVSRQLSNMESKRSGFYATGAYLLRTLLFVAVVLLAMGCKWVNVYGVEAGLFIGSLLILRIKK